MTLGAVLLIALLFVVLNGVFVAAEFGIIALPKLSIERPAGDGDRGAARLLRVLSSPDLQYRYVATAQLGITLASLGLGMYGEHALADIIELRLGHFDVISEAALATVIALAVLTVAHIVIGEMLPKGIALQNPERVARVLYWPMHLTLVVLYPFVAVSSWLAHSFLRMFGIRRQENTHEQIYTPQELQLIVEESEKGGALRSESGQILRDLFEFGDTTAGEVMVPRVRVIGLPVGASPDQIRRTVLEHRRTRYPVYDGDLDHIVGMLHAKDLLRRLINDEPVSALDVRRIPVIPETATLDDTLATMQKMHSHMAVVIDEHGGTAGIVNLEDLFEEVVGDIDEGASGTSPIVDEGDNVVRAAGTVRLDELGQHFHIDLEHEEVDSVSGLVLAQLGRPPIVGDEVVYGRLRLQVTAVLGRGAKEVRVWIEPETAP